MKKNKGELKRKLKAYAAATAGALAIAPQAEAAIHYSGPQNIVVDAGNPSQLVDLNGNTVPDFAFSFGSYTYWRGHVIYGYYTGNSIIDTIGPYGYLYAVNLPANYNIKGTLATGRYWGSYGYLDSIWYGNPYGNFIGQRGYIGVRFKAACGTAYGWIQYQANATATQGTIIDWAYEDTCSPIRAGDKGQPVAIPTLNQWGLLALAALLSGAAIRALKKQEQEEGSQIK